MNERIIRAMRIEDYDLACALWTKTPGMVLGKADEKANIGLFLERNPGLSFVCQSAESMIATVLCGHDGRRGYLYHLAVCEKHRKQGIGAQLVQRCCAQLQALGLEKCHLFVLEDNELGKCFWKQMGWTLRKDIVLFSKTVAGG